MHFNTSTPFGYLLLKCVLRTILMVLLLILKDLIFKNNLKYSIIQLQTADFSTFSTWAQGRQQHSCVLINGFCFS